MKKLFAIAVLMALTIFGFSQEYIQQPTSINTWNYVADYETELPFNKNITLHYDENGNLSYYYHVINYPSSGYYTWKSFTHDALNRLTFKQETYEEASYAISYRYYYTYDDSSNLLECLVEYQDRYTLYYTDEYLIDSKDVYQYEHGKRVRWNHYVHSTLVLQNYYLYDYSDDDTWSSETKYNANDQPVTKTEYTYSDHHDPLSVTVSNWSSETQSWLVASLTEFVYSEGRLIEKRITDSQQKKQLYNYDENGNCTGILFQTLVDSVYVDKNRALYLYDENGHCTNANAERWNDTTWVLGGFPSGTYLFFDDIYDDVNNTIGVISGCTRAEVTEYVTTPNPKYIQAPPNLEGEWYYEIQNVGTITYQHLEYAADTTIGNQRPKIIVRSNTHYDRDTLIETTHEYVYEENGKVYWWNKDLQEFTTLYDLTANEGDEWEIKVGTESITVHVDSVAYQEINNFNHRVLYISDSEDIFGGRILCTFGHMTSFFPEKLMRHNADFTMNGLRCYWVGDALLYHNGDDDCDAIYAELHNGINEDDPSTGSGTFAVYPNPANGILYVQTLRATSLPAYRITNLTGQTLMRGSITTENQHIDIESLPAGMYFISVGEQTVKFVKQ